MVHQAGNGNGWTRHYATQSDSNRLDRTWYGSNTLEAVTYRHDAHGNMLNLNRTTPPSQLGSGHEWGLDIGWDWRDMILAFDLGGGGLARYHYGIDKQRTRKYIVRNTTAGTTGTVEDRIYLGGYELYRRLNPLGTVVEEIESLQLFEGDQRVLLVADVIRTGGTISPRYDGLRVKAQTLLRYQYSNHLGSTCLELDGRAKIISYEEYHPYGTSAYRLMNSAVEAPPKRYRYTGMERDDESSLSYHNARYYASWLARWTASDPSGLSDGLNMFAYCRGSPTQLVDQRGRQGDRPKPTEADITAVKKEFVLQSMISLQMAGISTVKQTNPIMGFGQEFVLKRLMAAIGSPIPEETEQDVDAASWNPVRSAMTNFSLAEERSGRAVEALKAGDIDVAKHEAAMAGAAYGRHVDALGAVIGLARAGAGLVKGVGGKLVQLVSRELSRGLPFSAQRAMTRAVERSIRFERLLAHFRKGKVNEIMFEYAFKNADPAFFGGTEFAKRSLKTGAGETIYTGPGAKEGARFTDAAMGAKTEGGAPAKSGLELKARYGNRITDPLEEALRGEASKQLAKEAKAAEITHGDIKWGPNAAGNLDPYVPGEGGTGVATGWPVWLNWKPGWQPN